MNQQRWEMIREVFDAALELPSSEREVFIRGASQQDAEVYAELQNLLHADQEAGEFLESPLLVAGAFQQFSATELPLLPGEVLCQRFRILRAVGEGGMGYVFEAWDMELRRSVALKAIRPEVAGHPESLKRFRQEVSLALRITHPNVCRTFDIEREIRVVDTTTGRSREIVFLTMEFLQGETLAERLSRTGPLPLDHARHIARQIADALTCAHQLGIYHRDIKPANVMLVPATLSQSQASPSSSEFPRTVITDFGLARQEAILRSDGLSGVSSSGIPLGTFAYMAPEQLECAETSAATDIYAFGLVLFEMVTGKRAFSSSNPLSGIKQRLTGPAPSPQSVIPGLPETWCRAIEGCLRLNPAERLQNAADVMAILDGSKVSLPPRMEKIVSHAPSTRRLARAPWSIRRRVSALAMILIAGVSLSFAGLRLYQSKADSKVTPGALVYLTPVKNQTGEKAFDNLTELIQAGLTQSAQINLLDQGRVGDILQQMTKSPDTVITEPIAREIAMRAGAPRVVFATVTGTSGSYKLNIDIQQPDASSPNRYREHWPKGFEWRASGDTSSQGTIPQELLTAVRKTSDWIRSEAGESTHDIAQLNMDAGDVTTSNWQALNEFANAQRLISKGRKEDGILLLRKAIQVDSGFALAYAQLGDNLVSIDRLKDGYEAYSEALNAGSGQRLSRKERDFIKGSFASDTCDYTAAEEAFRDYSAFYENDYIGWFYQAYPLDMLDRPKDAIAVLQRAKSLSPSMPGISGVLAYNYLMIGDYDSAQKVIASLRKADKLDFALYFEGIDDFLENKLAGSEQSFRQLIHMDSADFRSSDYAMLARVQAEQGKYKDSLFTLSDGIIANQAHGNSDDSGLRMLDRAYIYCKVNAFGECLEETASALKLNSSPDSIIAASLILGATIPRLPKTLAHKFTTQLFRLEQLLPKKDVGQLDTFARTRIRGEILLATGDVKGALSAFRTANSLDAPLGAREYLARGLLAAAARENNLAQSGLLRKQALDAYQRAAGRPTVIWRNPWQYPPGFLADEMTAYLGVARQIGSTSIEVKNITKTLALLRGTSGQQTSISAHTPTGSIHELANRRH